ncbi:MAG: RDD family protein [Flavobacterium sp.]|nr:RDD family protein [Flavobacterium sp.]
MSQKPFTIDNDMLATTGQRTINYIIDCIIIFILIYAAAVGIMLIEILAGYTLKEVQDNLYRVSEVGSWSFIIAVALIYYNFFEILFARTIGKFITKTVVVDVFGEKPDRDTILLRSICRINLFEFLTFYSMPCVGWHDRISKTYVVQQQLLDSKKRAYNAFNANATTQNPTPNT